MPETTTSPEPPTGPPNESLGSLFLRFLRFGALAWGGPVAQIGMLREALVERERWISRARFHRVLAVYQALPGPEAHELCVYFGMLARGRAGAIVAGLGFMLPGLALMLLLSWAYMRVGLASPLWQGAMSGCQGAVAALVARAAWRLGSHALPTPILALIAGATAVALLFGANGVLVLAMAGGVHALLLQSRRRQDLAGANDASNSQPGLLGIPVVAGPLTTFAALAPGVSASLAELFASGLRAGLLTFGGAYTAIPFLRHDAVIAGGWMTDAQFIDGLALSSILPAPFVIFSTFVGYLGGGLAGALLVTAGVFLPAFSFTLLGHDQLERFVERPGTHAFLDGVTAGVVGVIGVTALTVARQTLVSPVAVVVFLGALLVLWRVRRPSTVAWVMLGAALVGVLVR